MPPKVEGIISVDADFSKADKKLQDFVKAMENKAAYKQSSVNRMTQPFLKSHFDKFLKGRKDFAEQSRLKAEFQKNFQERIMSYVRARAKLGAFGEEYKNLKTKKEKEEFLQERAKEFSADISQREKARTANQQKAKILQRRQQEEKARELERERKRNLKMTLIQDRALKENKAFDDKKRKMELRAQILEEREKEKNRKKLFNALFMKWGRLGIAGLIAGQAIKYIVRGATAINQVAQTSLGHQMTIEGGASGAGFFGKGLAAMQRAGISAKEYGSWKRGMMGKIGSIKLGMGNAAPFMALGVSTLDKLDDVELEIEKRLQRLPAETSWALGSQMGMSYELWERMYKGEIDRSKPGYDEDAMKAWAEAAKNINTVLTDIKVFFRNTLGPLARLLTSGEGIASVATAGMGGSSLFPGMIGYRTALDLSIKVNNDGTAKVDKIETQNKDTAMEVNIDSY